MELSVRRRVGKALRALAERVDPWRVPDWRGRIWDENELGPFDVETSRSDLAAMRRRVEEAGPIPLSMPQCYCGHVHPNGPCGAWVREWLGRSLGGKGCEVPCGCLTYVPVGTVTGSLEDRRE